MKIHIDHTTHITITGPWDENLKAVEHAKHEGYSNIFVSPIADKQFELTASKESEVGV